MCAITCVHRKRSKKWGGMRYSPLLLPYSVAVLYTAPIGTCSALFLPMHLFHLGPCTCFIFGPCTCFILAHALVHPVFISLSLSLSHHACAELNKPQNSSAVFQHSPATGIYIRGRIIVYNWYLDGGGRRQDGPTVRAAIFNQKAS